MSDIPARVATLSTMVFSAICGLVLGTRTENCIVVALLFRVITFCVTLTHWLLLDSVIDSAGPVAAMLSAITFCAMAPLP